MSKVIESKEKEGNAIVSERLQLRFILFIFFHCSVKK